MKNWIKIKGSKATHYFMKSEIIHFVWSKEIKIEGHSLFEGLIVSGRSGISKMIIGPQSLEAQMLKALKGAGE